MLKVDQEMPEFIIVLLEEDEVLTLGLKFVHLTRGPQGFRVRKS